MSDKTLRGQVQAGEGLPGGVSMSGCSKWSPRKRIGIQVYTARDFMDFIN